MSKIIIDQEKLKEILGNHLGKWNNTISLIMEDLEEFRIKEKWEVM